MLIDSQAHSIKQAGDKRHLRAPWLALGALLIGSGLLLGAVPDNAAATRSQRMNIAPSLSDAFDKLAHVSLPLALPERTDLLASPLGSDKDSNVNWHDIVVKEGDSLGLIFERIGASSEQLQEILALDKNTRLLPNIHPGQAFKISLDKAGQIKELAYEADDTHTLHLERLADGFRSSVKVRALERRLSHKAGFISSSLFGAAQEAGLSDSLTLKIASIFGYDIDFALDIRAGDRFIVVYEEYFADGMKVGDGDILAAEFTNQDATYRALRHESATGTHDYLTPHGKSLRKAFLRTPVEFSRISSGFNLARRHPILNRIRAHKGVDYAAPSGTPVRASSDGKVTFLGRKGGYGNTLELQHGKHYSTLYGHLSRYAKGLKQGDAVQQGETIAYVGMTGLATGPHLHYEFRVDGVHQNPLNVKFLEPEPLSGANLAAFNVQSRPLLAQLDVLRRIMIAYNAE